MKKFNAFNRCITIDASLLTKSLQDDTLLEGLAAGLSLKALHVNSVFTNHTIAKLKKVIHCKEGGHVFRCMIIHNICDIKRVNGKTYLQINKLDSLVEESGFKNQKYKIYITEKGKISINNKRGAKKYDITLSNMKRIIKKLALVHHLNAYIKASDLSKKMEEGNWKEKKAALKKYRSMQKKGRKVDFDDYKRGISFEKIAEFLGCCLKSAKVLVYEMVRDDKVIKKSNPTNLKRPIRVTHNNWISDKDTYVSNVNKMSPIDAIKAYSRAYGKEERKTYDAIKECKKSTISRTIRQFKFTNNNGEICVNTFVFYANHYEVLI